MITLYERQRMLDGDLRLRKSESRIFKFPGAEMHIDFKPVGHIQIAYVQGLTGDDLVSLAMWKDAIDRHPDQSLKTVLVMPYLPAARADRGTPLGAKVYADLINSMGFDKVICVDPHSDVAPALYERLTVVPLASLPFWASNRDTWDGIIVPDLGARKRAEGVAEALGGLPLYQATKHRDFATGELSGAYVEDDYPAGRYLIVDDICDGGRTFFNLRERLETGEQFKYDLWVTHGIFSRGIETLAGPRGYGSIFTTDSHFGAVLLLHNIVMSPADYHESGIVEYVAGSHYEAIPLFTFLIQNYGKV